MDSSIIEYYKTHNSRDTREKFGITYKQLKEICSKLNFIKSKEQIKETYKTTKVDKYGSLDKAYKTMNDHKNDTIIENYGSYDLYYEIRDNNSRKTNQKKFGTSYPMQNKEVLEKANNTRREK